MRAKLIPSRIQRVCRSSNKPQFFVRITFFFLIQKKKSSRCLRARRLVGRRSAGVRRVPQCITARRGGGQGPKSPVRTNIRRGDRSVSPAFRGGCGPRGVLEHQRQGGRKAVAWVNRAREETHALSIVLSAYIVRRSPCRGALLPTQKGCSPILRTGRVLKLSSFFFLRSAHSRAGKRPS